MQAFKYDTWVWCICLQALVAWSYRERKRVLRDEASISWFVGRPLSYLHLTHFAASNTFLHSWQLAYWKKINSKLHNIPFPMQIPTATRPINTFLGWDLRFTL
jgi:hypothetical protein